MASPSWSVAAAILIPLWCATRVGAQGLCDAGDNSALIDFKNDFIDSGNLFMSWILGTDCCTWRGVNCTSQGRVQGLVLSLGQNPFANQPNPDRNDTFPVGWSIGRLTALDQFRSSAVSFRGPIPSSWMALTNLSVLSLFQSGFTGTIPDFLGQLTKLNTLYVDGPGNLTGLLPAALCNLEHLEAFSFSQNQLSGELPSCLRTLISLRSIFLSDNSFSGVIPDWLSDLPALTTLGLSQNRFAGAIPASIGNATMLNALFLSNNLLSGSIPLEIGQLNQLNVFHAANNFLTGNIPTTIENLKALTFLDLSGNYLAGAIPPEVGSLQSLSVLFLERNLLSGAVPAEFGNIPETNGVLIQINDNRLSGTVPDTLSNVGSFLARNNNLVGGFPLSLASAYNVDLTNNSIDHVVGTIPTNPQLLVLGLGLNRLMGGIPSWLSSISTLQDVDISSNYLNGSLPLSLLTLPSLLNLNVSNNPLQTTLPTESFSSNIISLDLHNDQLFGPVPASFVEAFPNIQFLDLSENPGLTGTVPHIP